MTIIAIDARKGDTYPNHEVSIGGEPVEHCAAAFALWNGGPGYVVYYPKDVSGHIYLTPEGRMASAIRFGMVRVVRKENIPPGRMPSTPREHA